jgi:metal-responsive CopG/Arc/MetJ family transcriptional regulator
MAKGKPSGGLPPLEPGEIGKCQAHPVAFRLPRSLYSRMHEIVTEEGTTTSRILRDALAEYLDRRDRGVAA